MKRTESCSVRLEKVTSYEQAGQAVRDLLSWSSMPVSSGDKVLVKPNLLRADALSCTNAVVIAEVCRFLLDKGCRVTIGDSPGFGTAQGVAKAIGLEEVLEQTLGKTRRKDISLITLDSPVKRALRLGGSVHLSRHALEAHHLCNLPKLKAHVQMRVTASVKNLFGCVSGLRKALLHAQHGDKERAGIAVFPSAVVDILEYLPPMTTLLDAVTAMHVRGPSGGQPYTAKLLAASPSPVALDTVLYTMLGAVPEHVPVWRELQRRTIQGAFMEEVALAPEGHHPADFCLDGFEVPHTLIAETFNPVKLTKSMAKRLWIRFRHSVSGDRA